MREIKISLIIPMFNIEKDIEKCINSILNQDYSNYEIIVVNDGSTDNSENIVKNIKNKKVLLINKQNGGLSSARNEGVKYATGDYIWFVDGDDYIEQNALKKINNVLTEEKYDIISFKYFKEYAGKKVLQKDNIDILDSFQYPLVNTSACTKVFKKEFYIKNNFSFFEGRIYEDLSLIPFIMCKAESVKFINNSLYNYVYRENSIMNNSNRFNINRDDKFLAIERLYKLFKDSGIEEKYKNELEYLTIKHLLIVYSTEILKFSNKIYKNRCINVLKYLDYNNKAWYKNSYLKDSSILTRVYVSLFRHKLFFLCKISLLIKKTERGGKK